MAGQDIIDFSSWPVVPPEQRPRPLYVAGAVDKATSIALRDAGWQVCDVRLMPTETVEQRSRAILAFLEGVRLGSISAVAGQVKFVELEARICGLHTGKAAGEKPAEMPAKDLDELLSFGMLPHEER